jgi:two-component sensor histidine kinase
MFAGAVLDITERKKAEERQTLLINELNHRVKNTLSVVQSMAAQGASAAADNPKAFATMFGARLRALSRAHDVLTETHWAGASLGRVVSEALAPFEHGAGGRIRIAGPEIVVQPGTAVVLSMALHELATNASKYGALSVDAGKVDVRWSIADATVELSWSETGGPPVSQPQRKGFGSRLVTDGLAHQLDAEVSLEFPPEGVRYVARFPAEHVQEGAA